MNVKNSSGPFGLSIAPRSLMRAVLATGLAFAASACGLFGGSDDGDKTPTVGNRTPILSRIASAVEADPSLAGTAVVLPPARENAEWSQAGGNAAKNPGHVALSNAPGRAWTASIAGSSKKVKLAAAPVIGGGMLYAVGTDGRVHAMDAGTGASVWTYQFEVSDDLQRSRFGGGAAYFDGRVFATSGAGDVAALDARTGQQLWRVKPAGPLRGSPTIAYNSAYVMSQNSEIFALSLTDGSVVWQDTASGGQSGVFGVAAPASGQSTVIAGYSSGELVAYRYENGRVLWSDALARTSISTSVSTLTDVDADPIIDQGRVYALGQGGRMAAYELVTGQRLWELNLAGISTPTVAGEWVFTLTDDARLLAIQRTTGRVRWMTQLDRWRDAEDREGPIFWQGPVLASNRLWIASSRGKLLSADVTTGEVSEAYEFKAPVSLPPVVAMQTLYVLDDDGTITAFR
ncbi:PQQ-binding-like beta-propeller repeat protein [Paraurantiacibacter namhicola]|uniref:Outer membrane protein assembly factor BamB n=1 Tax=Paraurantiacibacter namhicola TaxID=645517 RepID=A0A1C7DAF5_9SPHN|nr:PQQ-binding-like beta-propeller repeat protein [Paraurantiacibacter namhicola]ANU08352.1 Outer membrane protein assembly factor BamB precursor [Paraurantiacibacter namhicola]